MLQLLSTSDGSHTIKNLEFNETYHSIHGAIQESNHVFIRNGLHYMLENHQPEEIRILEVGFGTGLNALLTFLDKKRNHLPVVYDGVEAFPLSMDLVGQLNYPNCLEDSEGSSFFLKMHEAKWNEPISITQNFTICKVHSDIQKTTLKKRHYNIVYFDAFAPKTQPELWDINALRPIVESLQKGGVFVTYSAMGQLKRDLMTLGLLVETLKGPPGKAQMVRASR